MDLSQSVTAIINAPLIKKIKVDTGTPNEDPYQLKKTKELKRDFQ